MKHASIALVWLIALSSGCAGPPPSQDARDQLTVGKVQGEIKVGMSGADVVQILGSPNIITTDDKRREVWVYDKISTDRMEAKSSTYGTLILLGGSSQNSQSSTRQRTLTVVIKFDEQNQVRDFAYNYTQF
jgi:outer membrane protein assembly factor BamE (lipoprotein component of BamABCDE complex)